MATESGNPGIALENDDVEFRMLRELLGYEPYRVQFFQAVRLLQRMEKGRTPVGGVAAPHEETMRFTTLPTFSFPASQLYDLKRLPTGQLQMTVQFMGLCAAVSTLPSIYTEYMLTRIREKDYAMAEFFDIFNHRLISFFYRGWEKYRFFVGYEAAGTDRLSPLLMDMLGLGTEGLEGRTDLPDKAYRHYVGLLGRHTRTADSLKQLLEDYFGVSVTVHQFAGTWRSIPEESRTRLSGTGRMKSRRSSALALSRAVRSGTITDAHPGFHRTDELREVLELPPREQGTSRIGGGVASLLLERRL